MNRYSINPRAIEFCDNLEIPNRVMIPDTKGEWVHIDDIAAELGRLGGLIKSEAKANASRNNGKLGGRPKKIK